MYPCSLFRLLVPLAGFFMLSAVSLGSALAGAPGGFVVSSTIEKALAAPPTATEIRAFLPDGGKATGKFTFPAPWNTVGVQLTDAAECDNTDCVGYGYNYWEKMNNSAGSNTLLILVGLAKHWPDHKDLPGATLLKLNKTTLKLTNAGAIFAANDPLSSEAVEQMSFSLTQPDILYVPNHGKMWAVNVLTKTKTLVYDADAIFDGTNKLAGGIYTQGKVSILSPTVSANDRYFAAVAEQSDKSYFRAGCFVYDAQKGKVVAFFKAHSTRNSGIHSCIIGKAGTYVWMSEYAPDLCGAKENNFSDSVMGTIATGKEEVLCNIDGGGGHRAIGYAQLVLADNESGQGTKRLWNLDEPFLPSARTLASGETQGGVAWQGAPWQTHPTAVTSHQSWMNAKPGVPLAKQYVCGAQVDGIDSDWHGFGDFGRDFPLNGDVVCFKADTQNDGKNIPTLVVAPSMAIVNTTSSAAPYAAYPKGVIDPTGHWYYFTSNHGSGRLDAFIVKIPCQKLSEECTSSTAPVAVSIISPRAAATVSGMVPVAASVSGHADIARVQFQLDGKDVGQSLDKPPFSIDWDTSTSASGNHSLTAIAFKDSGGSVTSQSVPVTVMPKDAPPPETAPPPATAPPPETAPPTGGDSPPAPAPAPKPAPATRASSGGGGFSVWILFVLTFFTFIQLWLRQRQRSSR